MARTSQRGSKNNNPEGRNQYSSSFGDIARDRPVATAAAAAAAVGAGVFLWSRRNQISEQLTSLSEQIGEWSEKTLGSRSGEFEMADGQGGFATSSTTGASGFGSTSRKSGSRTTKSTTTGEIGGGNAALGAHSGGGATTAGNSGGAQI